MVIDYGLIRARAPCFLDVNLFLNQHRPKDAFCICALSWFDFYADVNSNHILGMTIMNFASVAFSFGHYSKFKEMEAKQKEWEADFVVEPSIEINDNLNKYGQNDESPSSSSPYIFVTYNEMKEAENRINDYEYNCVYSKRNKSTKRPLIRQLSDRFQSLVRLSSKNSSSSTTTISLHSSLDDISDISNDEKVLSLGDNPTQVEIQQESNVSQQENNVSQINLLGYDRLDDVTRFGGLYDNYYEDDVVIERDHLVKSALTFGEEFHLDCVVWRRLFQVRKDMKILGGIQCSL